MKIKNKDIIKIIKEKSFNVFIIYGQDYGLVYETSNYIKSIFFGDSEVNSFNVITLEGSDIKKDPAILNDNAFSVSLLSTDEKKIIIIKDTPSTISKTIDEYSKNYDANTLVVIEAQELPPSDALRKLGEVNTKIAILPCYNDNNTSLREVILETLRKEQFNISRDALDYLVDHLGNDRAITKKELEKLILYKFASKNIDIEDVKNIIIDSYNLTFDSVVYNLFSSNIEEAYININRVDNENILGLLSYINNHVKKVLFTKEALETSSLEVAMKKIYPPIFFTHVDSFKRQLSILQKKHIMYIFNLIAQYDVLIKENPHSAKTFMKQFALQLYIFINTK